MNSKKIGLPPGTLTHIGNKKSGAVKITAINYNEQEILEQSISVSDLTSYKDKLKSNWINIDGLHNIDLIEQIGSTFNIHNLVLEDILNTQHRPKAEFSEQHLFFTLKMLGIHPKNKTIISEQVSFILGKEYLISFQEHEGDIFNGVRERLKNENSLMRKNRVDFLFYRLIDTVVDNYFNVIEFLSEEADLLEEKILTDSEKKDIKKIQHLKKELIHLKKASAPLREAVSMIQKDEEKLITKETQKYLRDVYEHIIQVSDFIEGQRDTIGSIMDLYHAEIGSKMNQIMQVLTIISTIFIPITFIAGIYGMNFDNMPELHSKNGYFIIWGIMIICVLIMLFYFKKKKWL